MFSVVCAGGYVLECGGYENWVLFMDFLGVVLEKEYKI